MKIQAPVNKAINRLTPTRKTADQISRPTTFGLRKIRAILT